MRYLLDTSALLAHFRQESGWEAVQTLFESEDDVPMIASVTLTEFGRRLRDLGADESGCDETLDAYAALVDAVVPIGAATARKAFEIGCRTPERLPLVDALIVAAATTSDAVLVHRDAHLRAIPQELVSQRELTT